jgi:hypothetical protein
MFAEFVQLMWNFLNIAECKSARSNPLQFRQFSEARGGRKLNLEESPHSSRLGCTDQPSSSSVHHGTHGSSTPHTAVALPWQFLVAVMITANNTHRASVEPWHAPWHALSRSSRTQIASRMPRSRFGCRCACSNGLPVALGGRRDEALPWHNGNHSQLLLPVGMTLLRR